ncbi:hypothetical protein EWM64_g3144, partial [Hericium alpestre]
MPATAPKARVPGETEATIFAWEMAPYKQPTSLLSRIIWGWRVWFEATFVFTLLEPWEKLFLVLIIGSAMGLLLTGIVKYLPQHLVFLYRRALYYLLGQEQVDWASVQRAGSTVLGAL